MASPDDREPDYLETVRLERVDDIAVLWLNRPHRNNAWNGKMHMAYRHRLLEADTDADVRAIVVTGEGRGFCVGGDAKALEGHVERGGYDPGTTPDMAMPGYGRNERFDAPFAYQMGLSKPIVAAMNGPAAGVGLALAAFADLRFAVPGVKFTTAHGKLNLPAEYGLSWVLPRLMGLGRANDLLLTSRVFLSDEALELGFVNALFPADQLLDETLAYVRGMLDTVSPNALRQTRWQTYDDLHTSAAEAVTRSEALIEQMMTEADYAEGVAAFMEKRPARWSDR
ncbi:MAG: enoyl-CoA hydratase [Acidimicrobiales bacterium]|nr:enoyl-CoA hydratase [Acidimicrobiales bacterium]